MWNAPNKPIPRSQIIDHALDALEEAHTAILEEEGAFPIKEPLEALCELQGCIHPHVECFHRVYNHPDLPPAMRFEAVGQALRLLRVQFGR